MAIIQFCCCWNSLRTGCFASAVYTMLYFSVTIIMVAIFGVVDESIDPLSSSSESTEDPKTLQVLNIFVVTLSGFGLVSTCLLIYGLIKKMPWCLMPWIVIVSCTTLVDLIYAIYLLAHTETLNPSTALVFTCDFFLVIVNVYCILCVISQYQEYEEQHTASRRMIGLAVTDELMDETHPPIVEFKLSDLQHHVVINEHQQQQQQQHQKKQEPVEMNDEEQSVMDIETCLWVDYRPNDDVMAKLTIAAPMAIAMETADREKVVGSTQQLAQPPLGDDQQQQRRRVTFVVASSSSS